MLHNGMSQLCLQISLLPLTDCVTLPNSLNLSELPLPSSVQWEKASKSVNSEQHHPPAMK